MMGGHYFSYSTSPFVGRLRVDLIFRQTPIGAGTATPLMQATSFVAVVGTVKSPHGQSEICDL